MANEGGATGASDEQQQIAVRLTTKDKRYSIPETKYFVPRNWKRFHLSELINKVLENGDPVPFDFLINSTLLRTTLGQFCDSNGLSTQETVIELEYLPSTLPPQLQNSIPSQDWVSDVVLSRPGHVLTASYDGNLSLQSHLYPSAITFSRHEQAALSCCFVQHPKGESSKTWVASGGMDRVVRIWEYEDADIASGEVTTPVPHVAYTLPLHTGPVSSVRASSSQSAPHLLTAGWDGLIGIWDVTPGVNDGEAYDLDSGERRKKRRKQASGVAVSKTPMGVLRGHSGKVSRALFDKSEPSTKAHSAGFDHTVRSWDLTTGAESASRSSSDKVILALGQMASHSVLVTGSFDKTVSFWDLRSEAQQTISLTLSGHSAPVASIAPHPTSQLLVASGSYDSTVRIWDARSPKQALFSVPLPSSADSNATKANEKILAIDWDGERLAAAGEGNRVVTWKVTAGQQPERT